MNPEGNKILALTVQRLATEIAPALGTAFGQGQIGLMSIMLTLVGNEYERGADLRANENRAMRALFMEAVADVHDAALKTRLGAAGKKSYESLRISALDKANWELRKLLIEVHAHIEAQPGSAARTLEKKIWALLRQIADQRMVKLTPE